MSAFKEIICTDWEDFQLQFKKEIQDPYNFVYRGQYNSDWFVETSFQRYYKKWFNATNPKKKIKKKDDMKNHLGILNDHYDTFKNSYQNILKIRGELTQEAVEDIDELMSYAQHHDAPTMLLDWTSALDTAIFFSISDEIKNPSNHANTAIFCLRKEKIRGLISDDRIRTIVFKDIELKDDFEHFNKDGVRFLPLRSYNSLKNNKRIYAQDGILLEFLAKHVCLEDYFKAITEFNKPILHKFLIPRKFALEQFKKMSSTNSIIQFSKIYPDDLGFAYESCFKTFFGTT